MLNSTLLSSFGLEARVDQANLILYTLAACAVTDILYLLTAVFFVWMWGEGQPSVWEYLVALGRRFLLWSWSALLILLVGLQVGDQYLLVSFAVMLFVVIMSAYGSVKDTREQIVQGGPFPLLSTAAVEKKQVIVVTGANTGIGKETVKQLAGGATAAHPDSTIFLLCRSVSKGEAAAEEIRSHYYSERTSCCRLHVVECDLSSFASVRRAAADIKAAHNSIDILINNAGVMMKDLSYTEDGHEMCLQANFLGHFLLTSLLLPHITTAVINLTSSTYSLAVNNFDADRLDDLQCQGERAYTLFGQYAATKWCNILHTVRLSQMYNTIFSAAIHPGLVRTEVVRNMPRHLKIPNEVFARVLQTLQKTPAQGAWCTVHVATTAAACTNDSSSQRGQYWVNRKPQPLVVEENKVHRQAAAVWDWACQQVGLTAIELERMNAVQSSTSPDSKKSQ